MSNADRQVLVEVNDGIGWIRLNRRDQANALDMKAAADLAEAVTRCELDDVRVVLITGEGNRFSVGGDITTFLETDPPEKGIHALASALEPSVRRLTHLSKPVVAGVQGAVAGAALGLVLAADLVVAARTTKFKMAYSGLGLTPDVGVSYLLPQAIGLRRALDLTLNGRTIDSEVALEWGLVSEVVDNGSHEDRALAIATAVAAGPSVALGHARRLLRASFEEQRPNHAQDEKDTVAWAVTTEQSQELIKAFLGRS